MILQSLVRHYEDLAARGRVPRLGWGQAKVSYALRLSPEGALLQTVSLKTMQVRGKKQFLAPQLLEVPMPFKRSVDVTANFLCDHSGYLLGVDGKGRPERTAKCFEASRALHLQLLESVDSPAARAVCAFFRAWQSTDAAKHPALQADWEEITGGGSLVFEVGDCYAHEDPAVRAAWQARYGAREDGPQQVCLVTGERAVPEKLHPLIKGVAGAQPTGGSLVSFNAPALESYGHEQGFNAPVSQYAAFAYGTALNHLLADREHCQRVGDTTVVFWSEGGEDAYQNAAMAMLFGAPEAEEGQGILDGQLKSMLSDLAQGHPVEFQGVTLDPNRHFYILGLAPNAARLSVRFFLEDRYQCLFQGLERHYQRLNIVAPNHDYRKFLYPNQLLAETVSRQSKEKKYPARLSSDLVSAIIFNKPYPAALPHLIRTRIRADGIVNRCRAAILKADMIQRKKLEEDTMYAYEDPNKDLAYNMGALFSVWERIQWIANPNINATIHDRYFSLAQDSPHVAFQRLTRLSDVQLRQASRRDLAAASRLYGARKSLMEKLDELHMPIPHHFSIDQKNLFILGYYHKKTGTPQKTNQEDKNND